MTHASITPFSFFPNSFAARDLLSKLTCEDDDKQSVMQEQLYQQLKATDN